MLAKKLGIWRSHCRRLACLSLATMAFVGMPGGQPRPAQAAPPDGLARAFADPPASARPAVYWAWVNGDVSLPQLTRDLEEFKAKGISKAYIFEFGARDPRKIVPAGPAFMGPESIKAIAHAIREAKRVGIEMGLVTSSSWNAGGTWVAPEHASMGLYCSRKTIRGPARFDDRLPLPEVPEKAPKRADGTPAFWKEVAVLAVPGTWPQPQSGGLGIGDSGLEKRRPEPNLPIAKSNPQSPIPDPQSLIPEHVVDLSKHLGPDGRLVWDVPPGPWTILRLVCSNNGQGLAVPSPNSQGLAIDHFSAEATRMHFNFFIQRLQRELGPLNQTALTTLYLCSYELRGAVWTPSFLDEFRSRRGYDMTPYLPALFGAKFNKPEVTERFDYDFRKTQGDLLVDNFYKTAAEICHKHGLLLCAEAGGPGPPLHNVPVDALKAQGAIDIPRGEFWTDQHLWVVKETACAAHIYGKRVCDMESFTSWRHWQDGPFDLKPFADRALCDGTNFFTFHTCPHSPPEAGRPGWVYAAGTHVGPTVTWWPMARPFHDYLARCSFLLQQGLFVGDVCYYYGDQGYNFVPPKRVDPSLGFGYDYDVTNAEVILTRMAARDGRIVLPDGMSYQLLVLPDRDDIDLEVLQKLDRLVQDGATIVGRKPVRATGLADHQRRSLQVRQLAEKLWGPCDGTGVKEHAYGQGRVIWGRTLREVFQDGGIGPDFGFKGRDATTIVPMVPDLDYIHRRTPDAEIYFVINKGRRWEDADCTFRVQGRQPELWMPDTGEIRAQPVFRQVTGGTEVPLRFPPAGSVFVVFRDQPSVGARVASDAITTARGATKALDVPAGLPPLEIAGPWEVRFPAGWGAPASKVFQNLTSWTEDAEDGVKYFSGIATYHKEIDIPPDRLSGSVRLVLDLGRVEKVAEVALNGKRLGVLWKPPFSIDITDAAAGGRNRLVVAVANTWSNRLVGDARATNGNRYGRTNIDGSLTGKVPWKDTPLLESGLLGPVQILSARRGMLPP
jgi:hypothetical protein